MNIVAVISEYNPFHLGHKYQIDKIREEFGHDTAIVAVMSGNYTQRAELAFTDKFTRAKAALLSGVDLVLEIPFPYSSQSAEFFAMAGVCIATEIGATHLSFGSECADISRLSLISQRMATEEYKTLLSKLIFENKELGYPALSERAYKEIYSESLDGFFTPNNILGIEYLKAIKRQNSRLIPHTVKRVGSAYDNATITDGLFQSASAIRALIEKDFYLSKEYLPKDAFLVYEEAYTNGRFFASVDALSVAILSYFRLNTSNGSSEIHDAKDGLYNRLCKCANEALSLSHLITLTETKKFTRARIRRAILNSYFGVTSSIVKELPEYTQVLAMNSIGKAILKNAKKRTTLSVITKPSSTDGLSETSKRQKELSRRADSIFRLCLKNSDRGDADVTATPFISE